MAEEDIEWSTDVIKLRDLKDHVTFPCVVRVSEGFYSEDDVSSFSIGDLLKIDSFDVIQKIRAFSYNQIPHDEPVACSIPVAYRGKFRVLSKHGARYVYTSVVDIIRDFPKSVKALKVIHGINADNVEVTIKKGDILETIGRTKPKSKHDLAYLKCKRNGRDVVMLTVGQQGQFEVQPDETEYNLKELLGRFPLPQVVEFVDQAPKETTPALSFEEAIGNLQTFNGKLMLKSVFCEPVLIGHYKGLQSEAAEESSVIKRTAVLIPLNNKDVDEIDVQYALHLDSPVYGVYVAKNFSQKSSVYDIIDTSPYFEFTRKLPIRFTEFTDTTYEIPQEKVPVVPPRHNIPNEKIPVVPPRRVSKLEVTSPVNNVSSRTQKIIPKTVQYDDEHNYDYPDLSKIDLTGSKGRVPNNTR